MSKPRWEVKFEKYMSEEPVSEKIEKLEKELSGVTEGNFKTKEEFDKADGERRKNKAETEKALKGYKNYEKNKNKILNILEYRKKLEAKLANLPPKPRDVSKELTEKKQELFLAERECNIRMQTIDDLRKELNRAKDDKDKLKIQNQMDNERELLGKAQDKQYKLMPEIQTLQNEPKHDEFADKRSVYERKIAKCNVLAANLLKGKELEDIELKVDTGRYTSKDGKLKEKIRDSRAPQIKDNLEKSNNTEKGKTDLVKTSEFEEKHPRLTKIGKFFKNIKDKVVSVFKGKNIETPEAKKEVEKIIDDEDRALYEIAEKGHTEYIKSLREAAKQKAANEYAEKYGGQYEKQDGATAKKKEDNEATR